MTVRGVAKKIRDAARSLLPRFLGPPEKKSLVVVTKNNGVRRREAKRAEWRAWNAARVARGWKPRRRPKTKRERREWFAQLRAVLTGGAS